MNVKWVDRSISKIFLSNGFEMKIKNVFIQAAWGFCSYHCFMGRVLYAQQLLKLDIK